MMTARASALVMALALATMALTASGGAAPSPGAAEQIPTASRLFAFHSGFWINLHHFLYEQAVVGSSAAEIPGLVRAEPERPDDASQMQALSDSERSA